MKEKNIEIGVGVFVLAGFLALCYLALNLGEVSIFKNSSTYEVVAEFDSVAGVKSGASVQIAGVVVGDVKRIWLGEDDLAYLALRVDNSVKLSVDSMASVKSQGIIGDKFIMLTPGGDEELLGPGDVITDTESALDIESLISKFAFGSAE